MPPEKQPTREEFIKNLFVLDEVKDNFVTDKEAQKKIVLGINKGVDAIACSYGPSGSNALIEVDLNPKHMLTNDGKTILDSISLKDKVENIGLDVLKEITAKSDKESGDGRKTSVLLAGAILKEGLKAEGTPMEIKRSLDECLPIIIESLDEQTTQITAAEVGQIATLSSENESLGQTFQEIYEIIGKEGVVEIDNSNLPDTSYEITEGVKLRGCGFTYPYMANEDKGRKAVYKNPYILITKQKIQTIAQIDPILKLLVKQGRNELVIFCDEIDLSVSQALAYIHMQGVERDGGHLQIKTLVIKAPTLWKDWLFEDFSKITGATIINPVEGTTLKNFQHAFFGTCEQITSSKDETVVLGIRDISEHIQKLKDVNDDDSKLRLAWLQTKTAILKLGANSETELSYLRGKASDARNASYLALNHGVVPGGGIALLNASKKLPKTIGGKILGAALQAPYKKILENMELPAGTKFGKDIIDPANVTKSAITNALSVVGSVLTTRLVILKK